MFGGDQARPPGDRLPDRRAPPRPTGRRACTGAPVAAPLRVRVVDRASVGDDGQGLCQRAARSRAHRRRSGRGSRRAALLGGDGRERSCADPPRARRGARAPPSRRGAGARGVGARRGARGDQRRRQRVRDPRGEGVAAAAGGDRAPGVDAARARGDADLVPGLDGRGRRRGDRGAVGGRPPPPAHLGGRAAAARPGVPDGDDHADRAPARPGPLGRRRRAAPHRSAPRRAVAARRGGDRAARHRRA